MISELFETFLKEWKNEKSGLKKQMEDNRTWNALFRKENRLTTKNKLYKENKKSLEVSKNNVASIVLSQLPNRIFKKAGLLNQEYKIEGSVGQGEISEIPWICIFDLNITNSAQEGFYIVYLFKSDLSGFYLSLNQGWTQYQREFGAKEGRIEIKKNANYARDLLKSDQGFSYNPINLKATKSLGKGYESGNICSVYYSTSDIPTEKHLINDLRNLIGVYRELKGLVGSEILEIKGKLDEDAFQQEIQKGKRKNLDSGAVAKKNKNKSSSSSSWKGDPNISYTALDNASFTCESNLNHETFESARTGHQFVEGHHLIPLEFQDDFEVSIDVPENIISLCPNCHRAFHNSVNTLKEKLIIKFYGKRIESLKTREINIELDKLFEYYKTSFIEV